MLDHLIRTVKHYGSVGGSQQAAGTTYFGFLSVFPVLLLAFTAVGVIAKAWPNAQDTLVKAITTVLPGLIGNGQNQLSLTDIQHAAGAAGLFGLLGVLYAGLGWLSALRTALITVFDEPPAERPNFIVGKLRDLSALVVLGAVLLLGVALSGLITHFSGQLLDWAGLGGGLSWLVAIIAIAAGVAAGVLMFFLMFVLLARPRVPQRELWRGALLAAVGFEVLKQLSALLLGATAHQPAAQAFGIALILLVWINYFSQVTLYAAAWAHTSDAAEAQRIDAADAERAAVWAQTAADRPEELSFGTKRQLTDQARGALAGAGAMLAAVVLINRKKDR
ncbi:YihY/virulence factor BrkB family protein [Nocardioides montaniterrae]